MWLKFRGDRVSIPNISDNNLIRREENTGMDSETPFMSRLHARSELYLETFLSRPLCSYRRGKKQLPDFLNTPAWHDPTRVIARTWRNVIIRETVQEAFRFAASKTMALYDCSHAFAVK